MVGEEWAPANLKISDWTDAGLAAVEQYEQKLLFYRALNHFKAHKCRLQLKIAYDAALASVEQAAERSDNEINAFINTRDAHLDEEISLIRQLKDDFSKPSWKGDAALLEEKMASLHLRWQEQQKSNIALYSHAGFVQHDNDLILGHVEYFHTKPENISIGSTSSIVNVGEPLLVDVNHKGSDTWEDVMKHLSIKVLDSEENERNHTLAESGSLTKKNLVFVINKEGPVTVNVELYGVSVQGSPLIMVAALNKGDIKSSLVKGSSKGTTNAISDVLRSPILLEEKEKNNSVPYVKAVLKKPEGEELVLDIEKKSDVPVPDVKAMKPGDQEEVLKPSSLRNVAVTIPLEEMQKTEPFKVQSEMPTELLTNGLSESQRPKGESLTMELPSLWKENNCHGKFVLKKAGGEVQIRKEDSKGERQKVKPISEEQCKRRRLSDAVNLSPIVIEPEVPRAVTVNDEVKTTQEHIKVQSCSTAEGFQFMSGCVNFSMNTQEKGSSCAKSKLTPSPRSKGMGRGRTRSGGSAPKSWIRQGVTLSSVDSIAPQSSNFTFRWQEKEVSPVKDQEDMVGKVTQETIEKSPSKEEDKVAKETGSTVKKELWKTEERGYKVRQELLSPQLKDEVSLLAARISPTSGNEWHKEKESPLKENKKTSLLKDEVSSLGARLSPTSGNDWHIKKEKESPLKENGKTSQLKDEVSSLGARLSPTSGNDWHIKKEKESPLKENGKTSQLKDEVSLLAARISPASGNEWHMKTPVKESQKTSLLKDEVFSLAARISPGYVWPGKETPVKESEKTSLLKDEVSSLGARLSPTSGNDWHIKKEKESPLRENGKTSQPKDEVSLLAARLSPASGNEWHVKREKVSPVKENYIIVSPEMDSPVKEKLILGDKETTMKENEVDPKNDQVLVEENKNYHTFNADNKCRSETVKSPSHESSDRGDCVLSLTPTFDLNSHLNRYAGGEIQASLLTKFGRRGHGCTNFSFPIGLTTKPNGEIIACDTGNNMVKVFTASGLFLKTLTGGTLKRPSSPAAHPTTGEIFVKDDIAIHVFSDEGEYQWTIGREFLSQPYGLKWTSDYQHLVTMDRRHRSVFVLSPSGDLKAQLPYEPFFNSLRPRFRFLDVHEDKLIAVNLGEHEVVISSLTDGRVITKFGGQGRQPGLFNEPSGVCCDGAGNIIVADSRNDRIQVFDPLGNYLSMIRLEDSIHRPSDIHLTRTGALVVDSYLEHCVKVFTFDDCH